MTANDDQGSTDDMLRRLAETGASVETMAAAIGKRQDYVRYRLRHLQLPVPDVKAKPAGSDAAWRKCLRCQRRFPSEHKGNRICGKCKQSTAWRSPVDDMTVSL